MAERVFVDVGAHAGSTALAVFSSKYAFDRVVSVEPDPEMVRRLAERFPEQLADKRLVIAPFAIAQTRGSMTLYGSNAGGGASLVAEKVHGSDRSGVAVETLSWGDFLDRYDLRGSDLYVKINCEGGEIAIVESIIEHDRGQIRSMVIDYDIIKSPWGGWKKWASISALKRAQIPFLLTESVFVKGANNSRIENWLGGLREFESPPKKRAPINIHQFARVKWIEVISALGVRHDFLKRR